MRKSRTFPILLIIILLLLVFLVIQGCGKREAGQIETGDSASAASTTESRVDSELGVAKDTALLAPEPQVLDTTKQTPLDPIAEEGRKLYANASLGKIKVSCIACHATKRDNRLRQGHTLAGVTKRPTTWWGQFKGAALARNAYGATLCANLFMEKSGGLTAAEIEALNAYLASLETAPGAITRTLTIQLPAKPPLKKDQFIDSKVAKPFVKAILQIPGDPATGEKLFARACANCHNLGTDKIGPALKEVAAEIDYVVTSIRFGSSAMAFYATDVLSDQQIADIVAYIQSKLGQ